MLKKEYQKLYDYFRSLSGGTSKIDIQTFNKAFKGKEYMERVTSGLFNYLDKDNLGYVNFEQFLLIYHPHLSKKEAKTITDFVVFF